MYLVPFERNKYFEGLFNRLYEIGWRISIQPPLYISKIHQIVDFGIQSPEPEVCYITESCKLLMNM